MANREIIIRIPEEKYDRLIRQMRLDRNFNECEITELGEHGNLKDADVLNRDLENAQVNLGDALSEAFDDGITWASEVVSKSSTIIKANHPAPVKEKHKNRDDDWER